MCATHGVPVAACPSVYRFLCSREHACADPPEPELLNAKALCRSLISPGSRHSSVSLFVPTCRALRAAVPLCLHLRVLPHM